jgi:hypothetical protein
MDSWDLKTMTYLENRNIHPVKPPKKTDLILDLIKAEIKNRKLLSGLIDLGFDTTPYTIEFSQIVLSLIGFEKLTEDQYKYAILSILRNCG